VTKYYNYTLLLCNIPSQRWGSLGYLGYSMYFNYVFKNIHVTTLHVYLAMLIVWIVATPGDKILQLHSFFMQISVTEMGLPWLHYFITPSSLDDGAPSCQIDTP